jgi:hypothetical protein
MPTKGIIFYTDNRLEPLIANRVMDNLRKVADEKGIPIVCSSLKKMTFGDKNIHFPSLKRSIVTMFKQIYAALENSTADIIYFCEHDVLYPACHFDYTPRDNRHYCYNEHVWKMEVGDKTAMRHYCGQTSGLCGYRELLLNHYKKRLTMIDEHVKSMGGTAKYDGYKKSWGFEPGKYLTTHNEGESNQHSHYIKGRIDNVGSHGWRSEIPLVDIKHSNCLTANYWQLTVYRTRKYLSGYLISDTIPGWGKVVDII